MKQNIAVGAALFAMGIFACGGREDGNNNDTVTGADDAGNSKCPSCGVSSGDGGIAISDASTNARDGSTNTNDASTTTGDAGACALTCDGTCVSAEDPAYGCGSCHACAAPANSVATCGVSACAFACNPGYSVCGDACCACGDTTGDVNNCGYCGHVCGGTATCTSGVCEDAVLAQAQVDAYAIAVDETNVYWTVEGTGSDGMVMKLALSGGGVATPLATGLSYPATIAIDATTVYFATEENVMSVPIAGGNAKTLGAISGSPVTIAVDANNVYVALDPYSPTDKGSIVSVPIIGGTVKTIAPSVDTPRGLAIAGKGLIYADSEDMFSVATQGGGAKSFESQQYAEAITADATHVYWASGLDNGAVMESSLTGGVPIELASNQFYPDAIAVDADNVYFTIGEGGGGTVMKVQKGGGTPVALATAQAYPTSVAVNSTHVFWVNFGTGTINSVAK